VVRRCSFASPTIQILNTLHSAMLAKYTPSGRCSALMIPASIALIALGACIGWAYQWGLDHFGARRLPLLVVVGATALLWFCVFGAMIVAKCRAPLFAALVGLLTSLAAIGVSHYVKHEQAVAAGGPPGIRDNFGWRAARGLGARPATGSRPARAPKYTGGMVVAMWWGEGLLLAAASVIGGVAASIKPFCESCSRHAGNTHWMLRLDRPPAHELAAVTKASEVREFIRPPWTEQGDEGSALVYFVKVCPSCGGVPTLNITYTKKEGGASWWLGWIIGWVAWFWQTDGTTELHSNLLLTEEEIEPLTEWAAGLPGFASQALEEPELAASETTSP